MDCDQVKWFLRLPQAFSQTEDVEGNERWAMIMVLGVSAVVQTAMALTYYSF